VFQEYQPRQAPTASEIEKGVWGRGEEVVPDVSEAERVLNLGLDRHRP